jgi:hypothetical protein
MPPEENYLEMLEGQGGGYFRWCYENAIAEVRRITGLTLRRGVCRESQRGQ